VAGAGAGAVAGAGAGRGAGGGAGAGGAGAGGAGAGAGGGTGAGGGAGAEGAGAGAGAGAETGTGTGAWVAAAAAAARRCGRRRCSGLQHRCGSRGRYPHRGLYRYKFSIFASSTRSSRIGIYIFGHRRPRGAAVLPLLGTENFECRGQHVVGVRDGLRSRDAVGVIERRWRSDRESFSVQWTL
ncbi:hypothetical protein QBC37DRAFT_479502, partial [Rhypophila decipiens]